MLRVSRSVLVLMKPTLVSDGDKEVKSVGARWEQAAARSVLRKSQPINLLELFTPGNLVQMAKQKHREISRSGNRVATPAQEVKL